MNRRRTATALAIVALIACRRSSVRPTPTTGAASTPGASASAPPRAEASTHVLLDLLDSPAQCRVEHRGALIELGKHDAPWSTPGRPEGSELPTFERDGATWGRVFDRTLNFTVALDDSGTPIISVRARARTSKRVTATLDGKVVGTLVFSAQDGVSTVTNASLSITPGLHTLGLRWIGAAKKDDAFAEVDWVRVGVTDNDPSAYAAPTARDVRGEAVIGGAPRRGFLVRNPSAVRCAAWLGSGTKLVAEVGVLGEGSSEVEVRVREPTRGGLAEPKTLARVRASRDKWVPLSVEMPPMGVSLVEILTHGGTATARTVIAEPRLVHPNAQAAPNQAEGGLPKAEDAVVVLVMAGLTPSQLASSKTLAHLAETGTRFTQHRAPSTYAGASMASLLSGLPVPVHALDDPSARLSPKTALLSRWLNPFGFDNAMFTEVPTTGPAFGFAQDWRSFGARSPLDGPPVAIDELSRWLHKNPGAPRLAVIHARGAHPPWDLPSGVLRSLPPENYSGPIEPRHAVTVLAKVRRGVVHLNDNDVIRALALQSEAIGSQETKLATLLDELASSGQLDRTTFIVTGDAPYLVPPVASSVAGRAPDDPGVDPRAIPLVIRFAHGWGRGQVIEAPTDPTDVAATVLAMFGARPGPEAGLTGRDLAGIVRTGGSPSIPHLVDDGRSYQLTWGDLQLVGTWGKLPSLRVRGGSDELRASRPYEYLAAWALAADSHVRWIAARSRGPGREPATIDSATAAALDSWERQR